MAGRPRSAPSRPDLASIRVEGAGEPVDIQVLKQALHRPTVDDLKNVLWRIAQNDARGGEQLGALRLLAEIQGLIGRASLHLHARVDRPEMGLSDEELDQLIAAARKCPPLPTESENPLLIGTAGEGENDGEAG